MWYGKLSPALNTVSFVTRNANTTLGLCETVAGAEIPTLAREAEETVSSPSVWAHQISLSFLDSPALNFCFGKLRGVIILLKNDGGKQK